MEMLCYWHSFVAFHTGGVQGVQATCALCNKQHPQFAKSALHHAGLESHLQTKLPPLSLLLNVQPKPGCLASSSVLPVPNVQVAGEGEQALQGRLLWGWGTSSWLGPWRSSAGQLSAQGSRYCFSSWSLESARLLASVFWPWGLEGRAPEQSEQTQGDCASLQQLGRKVVWQINEVLGTLGSKDHCTAAEALSTVQLCWIQPCFKQDHLHMG